MRKDFTENEIKEALNTSVEMGLLKIVSKNGETAYVETEYAHYILAARREVAEEMIKVYDSYIKLMCAELDELVGIATAHGWKSHRYKEGVKCREAIESLESRYLKEASSGTAE